MSRIAAIDLGTNSMRLLLCEVENGVFQNKKKEIITTRIGKNLSQSGVMSEKSMIKNIEALKYFKKKAEDFGVEDIIIIATSALRDADNKDVFLQNVKNEAGLNIKVIAGDEEAYIGMLGATYGTQIDESILIVDVGGGSTELVLSEGRFIKYSTSINAGAVRMTENYIINNPIEDKDVKILEKCLQKLFSETLTILSEKKIDKVIAIGGTATTAAAIFHEMEVYNQEKIHNTILDRIFLDELFEKLKLMSVCERYNVKGLEKERADIIPAGLYIIKFLMDRLKKDSILVSENDNLEGAVIKYSSAFNQQFKC